MRKTNKVLSLTVAGLMASSTSAVTAFSVSAAEDVTETKIYFEVPTEIWADALVKTDVSALKVYAHTYAVAGDPDYKETSWQTKGEVCKYVSGNIYSYDIDAKYKRTLKDGADYVAIFSIVGDKSYQTCNVTMGKSCYGDTIVVTGETYENSQDSQKKDYRSVWKSEANAAVYGPKLEITSTGRVVGESIPTSITAEEMVAQFLHEYGVKNASILTPEKVQETCANEFINAAPKDVYDLYVSKYADELADPETYPNTASAEKIAEYLGVTPEAESTYVVAGSEELCGVLWKGSPEEAPENVMTKNADGTYTKVFSGVAPAEKLQVKVAENTANGEQNWIGDATGNNITFDVTDTCDVTVTYNPSTSEITVTGDAVKLVKDIVITSMHAVGNGDPDDESWLNGAAWDPTANEMEQVADKVYEITYHNVTAFDNYQVKFAANGTWADSWGSAEEGFTPESGVAFDAVYNGQNITVNVPYELADVTLRIDLSNFNYATKLGAVATVTVTEASQVPTTAPETTVPETTVPETTVPETTVPGTTAPATTVPGTTVAQNTTTPNTTLAPATEDATSSTGATVKPGTADTANNGNNGNNTANNNNGTVKTGNASMAAVILLVLVSATGVVYFTRKKVK